MLNTILRITTLICCCCLAKSTVQSECIFKLDNDGHSPILLLASTQDWFPLTYSPKGFARVPTDVSVRLICPDTPTNRNAFTVYPEENDLVAKCKDKNVLEINYLDSIYTHTYPSQTLRCTRTPIPIVVETGRSCKAPVIFNTTYMDRNWEILSVGYWTRQTFMEVYGVCFDKHRLQVVYAHNMVLPDVEKTNGITNGTDTNHTWISDKELFNDINIDTEYDCTKQQVTFGTIDERFLRSNERCCFEKTQLVNAADLVYHAQKIATFHNINTVPRCILHLNHYNMKDNWIEIERRVRKLSVRLRRPLTVWTGTHTPADTVYVDKELYIHYDNFSQKSIPVPLFLWKVVYDPATDRSVVIIGINDQRWTRNNNVKKLRLCQDMCERINWMKFSERLNVNIGYVYCCELETFKLAFKFEDSPFPKENKGLLYDDSGS